MPIRRSIALLLACLSLPAAAEKPGVVSHVQVLTDQAPDLSSIAAWKKAFIKEGMSDQEKAMAVWKSVVLFQHQEQPPREYLQVEGVVLDPIKMANVYGYSLCSVASAHVIALAREAGLQARGWSLNKHVVSEIFWDGKWHLMDASLITYFPDAQGNPASVEEIVDGVKEWFAEHPELKGDEPKLRAFMRGSGWRKGPEVLSRCPHYDENGWLPAATHGWYSTMMEYDGKQLFPFESGTSTGYQVNVALRPGWVLNRNWSNKGLHINMEGGGSAPLCLAGNTGKGDLRYTPTYGDTAPGRVGNGTLEYEVPLNDPRINLSKEPGVLELRVPSSYVYLGGKLTASANVGGGESIDLSFSDNNGLDWKPLSTITTNGEHIIDLKPLVFRRYDYRLRISPKGKSAKLESLHLSHDIQHSQRPLPALVAGKNTIRFSTGPQEGTITLEGSTELSSKGKQVVFTDLHPVSEGLVTTSIRPEKKNGTVTFPVETPGDINRLRIHTFYRARNKADAWEVQVSFDEGKSFKSIETLTGPYPMMGKALVFSEIPPKSRRALIRYVGNQVDTAAIFNFRIDADYAEPDGGFRPVKVTYVWDENGTEKRDVHIANQPEETYTIECAAKPVMKSLVMELAD